MPIQYHVQRALSESLVATQASELISSYTHLTLALDERATGAATPRFRSIRRSRPFRSNHDCLMAVRVLQAQDATVLHTTQRHPTATMTANTARPNKMAKKLDAELVI